MRTNKDKSLLWMVALILGICVLAASCTTNEPRQKKVTILQSGTDERGLTSITWAEGEQEWGLDYLNAQELDSVLTSLSNINYDLAIEAVMETERTDSDIEMTMLKYGFNKAWHEDITQQDKISALYK
jgi:hypothetical protein